ncbi:hypothetical protein [Gimesia panareensis]|uniref:hypothetical protein n=1 Tax=Gimesia panareensis TaxID=2527978 RepID=UPI00118C7468|nr:hypothetical protein [Gimesia panareensis]QDU53107.1 hypothetical protein Pan110_54910 [Gimesia panareensis]
MSEQGQESFTVIVRADKEMRALASKAMEIQDASNYTTVLQGILIAAHLFKLMH